MAGQATSVQSLIDGVFPYRAEVARGYLSAIIANFNAQSLVDHLAGKTWHFQGAGDHPGIAGAAAIALFI